MQLVIKEAVEQGHMIGNVSGTYLATKRVFDIAISLLALAVLSPVLLLTAIVIKFNSGGTIVHTEERYGLKGIRYKTCEFRLKVKAPFIRKLPLLINVLKGDMSIVGPQPIPMEALDSHNTWCFIRMSAKPGLTGLWQTSGKRGGINEMLRVDLKYIRERSFWHDIKILLKAIRLVFDKRLTAG